MALRELMRSTSDPRQHKERTKRLKGVCVSPGDFSVSLMKTNEWSIVSEETLDKTTGTLFADVKKTLFVVIDGSARTRLYISQLMNTILGNLLKPTTNSNTLTLYIILAYGDYPPASRSTVETIYFGTNAELAIDALSTWPFSGGAPLRNALHEGIAAVLDILEKIKPNSIATQNISCLIISSTLIYEEFHSLVHVQNYKMTRGKTMEDLLREMNQKGIIINYIAPSLDTGRTFINFLEKTFHQQSPTSLSNNNNLPKGWIMRVAIPETIASRTAQSPINDQISNQGSTAFTSTNIAAATTTNNGNNHNNNPDHKPLTRSASKGATNPALETAVKQYLATVIKLAPDQRAEAIRQHLESPAFSAEYKECLISMVKRMQTHFQSIVAPNSNEQTSLSNILPMLARSQTRSQTRKSTPIWTGRLAFRHSQLESCFDIAACPIPNPKSSNPQGIPLSAEYACNIWPIVLAVTSFVSVQSPAVISSVPICKLVELIPYTQDATTTAANNDISNGFRNLLLSNQLVGLVRLAPDLAMLIAARPHQIVGMVIFRPNVVAQTQAQQTTAAAATTTTTTTAPQTSATNVKRQVFDIPKEFDDPSLRANLTPDEILRHHRPGTASLPAFGLTDANNGNERYGNGNGNGKGVNSVPNNLDLPVMDDSWLDLAYLSTNANHGSNLDDTDASRFFNL